MVVLFFPLVHVVLLPARLELLPLFPARVLSASAAREGWILPSAALPACFFLVEEAQLAYSVVMCPHHRCYCSKLSCSTKVRRVINEVELVVSIASLQAVLVLEQPSNRVSPTLVMKQAYPLAPTPFLQKSSFLRPDFDRPFLVQQTPDWVLVTWDPVVFGRQCEVAVWIEFCVLCCVVKARERQMGYLCCCFIADCTKRGHLLWCSFPRSHGGTPQWQACI